MMMKWTSALVILITSMSVISATHQANNKRFEFDVFLEDERIGTHRVELDDRAGHTTVTTTANFVYRILFLPVYTYDHRTVETWQGSCLTDIHSTTDDNGDQYFINSSRNANSLLISTQSGNDELDGCVRTYAYWDVELLRADKLLNTQNGEYQEARFTELGEAKLDTGDSKVTARRFELVTEEGTITLWYDNDGNWIALESKVENGSLIRYLSTRLTEGNTGS